MVTNRCFSVVFVNMEVDPNKSVFVLRRLVMLLTEFWSRLIKICSMNSTRYVIIDGEFIQFIDVNL
jgi:hypothetical protein